LSLPAKRVAKWRLYDPVFQAALNVCRAEVWQASIDQLRSMIPQALDTLAEELSRADNPDRCKLALDILRLAKVPDIAPQGPADPETIARQAVNRERQQTRGPSTTWRKTIKACPASKSTWPGSGQNWKPGQRTDRSKGRLAPARMIKCK
jgi:hypothetical protein